MPSAAFAQDDDADDPIAEAAASEGEDTAEAADETAEAASNEAGTDEPEPGEAAQDGDAAEAAGEASGEAEADVTVGTGSGLFEQSLSGDVPTSDTEDSATSGAGPGVDWNGYVRGDVFVGKQPGTSEGEIKAAYGEFALQMKAKDLDFGTGFAEARLRYGRQGYDQDLIVDLREAYVESYWGPMDLRVGKQIVVWGRADAFNPTNNVTPLDLRVRSPIEDDRRVGNVGARMFLNFSPIRVEGVWMPIYTPTEIPDIGLPNFVALDDPSNPDATLSNGLGAGRVHLELPSFEMSVSYLYGHAPMPGIDYSRYTIGLDAAVYITRTPYDHHVIGFDFSTAFGDLFALRGEAAYRKPVNWEDKTYAPRPDLQYVVGVDRTFGSVSVIAQYMGRYTFDWEQETALDRPFPIEALQTFDTNTPMIQQQVSEAAVDELGVTNQILFQQAAEIQHLASLRLEWLTAHETLSISALGLVNVTTKEWVAYPKIGYRISDAMSTYVGAEIYAGDDDTLAGLVDETLTAGYAELRVSF